MSVELTCIIIDDDRDWVELIQCALVRPGLNLRTTSFTHPDTALSALRRQAPDLVIVDLKFPGRSGISIIRELRTFNTHTPVILTSCHVLAPSEWTGCGANVFVQKRALNSELPIAVGTLLQAALAAPPAA